MRALFLFAILAFSASAAGFSSAESVPANLTALSDALVVNGDQVRMAHGKSLCVDDTGECLQASKSGTTGSFLLLADGSYSGTGSINPASSDIRVATVGANALASANLGAAPSLTYGALLPHLATICVAATGECIQANVSGAAGAFIFLVDGGSPGTMSIQPAAGTVTFPEVRTDSLTSRNGAAAPSATFGILLVNTTPPSPAAGKSWLGNDTTGDTVIVGPTVGPTVINDEP